MNSYNSGRNNLFICSLAVIFLTFFTISITSSEASSPVLVETFKSTNVLGRDWIPSKDSVFTGEWQIKHYPEVADETEEEKQNLGLFLSSTAKRHAISTVLPRVWTPKGSNGDFVVQYEVRLHKHLECGGAYMKLLEYQPGSPFDPKNFNNESPYVVMFGPDKCGTNDKVHFIFRHKNPKTGEYEEKHLKSPPVIVNSRLSHLYTLVVRKDNSFEIFIDKISKKNGNLLEDFDPPVNPPKEIDDPKDLKPKDWVDEAQIPDPNAKKPKDWDETLPQFIPDDEATMPADWLEEEPAQIPDPSAETPKDWDEELDGDFEPPMIDNPKCKDVSGCGPWERPSKKNPDYKGKWTPPMIDNPKYKGPWAPRKIPNPSFFEDKNPSKFSPIVAIGFELWSMQSDIEFDNIYLGDDLDAAFEFAETTFVPKSKKQNELQQAQQRKDKVLSFYEGLQSMIDAMAKNPVPTAITIIVVIVATIAIVFLLCRSTAEPKETAEDLAENINEDLADMVKKDDAGKDAGSPTTKKSADGEDDQPDEEEDIPAQAEQQPTTVKRRVKKAD